MCTFEMMTLFGQLFIPALQYMQDWTQGIVHIVSSSVKKIYIVSHLLVKERGKSQLLNTTTLVVYSENCVNQTLKGCFCTLLSELATSWSINVCYIMLTQRSMCIYCTRSSLHVYWQWNIFEKNENAQLTCFSITSWSGRLYSPGCAVSVSCLVLLNRTPSQGEVI